MKAIVSENRQSDWTASAVVTPVSCASVETVTFGGKTYNSVVVNWTTTGAGTWNIRYKTAKEQDWTVVEGNIAENTKKLEGLTPGEVYTIAVKPSCNDDEEAWVAAAETYTPLYTAPSNVKVTGITETTASASWDAVADAPDGYLYVVSAKDAEPAWNKATQTEELTATLSDLEAATEYDLHVVTKYGQYYSSDSKVSFTTSTVAPKNLTLSAVTATTATLTWEYEGAATAYEYAVGDDPDALEWNGVAEMTKILEGLTANTSYTFYVRAKYSDKVKSDSVNITFRTDCNAIAELPWFEGFEDMAVGNYKSAAPACW
ncbi:MAG: fibronectin type III domain-containing protein, partial [Paludibacteraceae bacterium]|nr:fibronectin type III domain-containing protein [Paludibacteraceae bacterium]